MTSGREIHLLFLWEMRKKYNFSGKLAASREAAGKQASPEPQVLFNFFSSITPDVYIPSFLGPSLWTESSAEG